MKYQIIGWTAYDDPSFAACPPSYAAENAIVDELRAQGYRFTGYHHQENAFCCPVLNDGKKRLFSQRAFGELMARAQGLEGIFDYANFSYPREAHDDWHFPTQAPRLDEICPANTLCQTVALQVDAHTLKTATHDGMLSIVEQGSLRLLERGDQLLLRTPEKSISVSVTDVQYEKDLTEDELLEIDIAAMKPQNKERFKRADTLYKNAKKRLLIRFED